MNQEILLTKLGHKMDRRSFLRGSGLAAAALVGVTAFPLVSAAQDQTPDAKKDDKPAETDQSRKDDKAGDKPKSEPDPFKETKKDESGRDYRMCPQCGYNMYKQDKTWTCENCGFSYAE